MGPTPYRLFRWAAIAEAVSWVGLLTGMFFKYVVVHNDAGVWFFGRLHGALFVAYLAAALWAAYRGRWRWWHTAVGLLAAVPPLATLWFEWWISRRTGATVRAPEPVTPAGRRA